MSNDKKQVIALLQKTIDTVPQTTENVKQLTIIVSKLIDLNKEVIEKLSSVEDTFKTAKEAIGALNLFTAEILKALHEKDIALLRKQHR